MATRNAWIWGGFGALLFVGILSGYAPDLMLARELRAARDEGLLNRDPSPTVRRADDARLAYASATARFPNAPSRLAGDFARQVVSPDLAVSGYLAAMARASARPGYAHSEEDSWYGRGTESNVFLAGKALAMRAKTRTDLLAAARLAGHLRSQRDLTVLGYGALLVPRVLDRAAALDLDAAPIRAALAPSLTPREALRRHVAETVARFEREARAEGAKVTRTRREAAYLRFWRPLFAENREGPGFEAALGKAEAAIQPAESSAGIYTDLRGIVGATSTPWTAWVAALTQANARLKAP